MLTENLRSTCAVALSGSRLFTNLRIFLFGALSNNIPSVFKTYKGSMFESLIYRTYLNVVYIEDFGIKLMTLEVF